MACLMTGYHSERTYLWIKPPELRLGKGVNIRTGAGNTGYALDGGWRQIHDLDVCFVH